MIPLCNSTNLFAALDFYFLTRFPHIHNVQSENNKRAVCREKDQWQKFARGSIVGGGIKIVLQRRCNTIVQ